MDAAIKKPATNYKTPVANPSLANEESLNTGSLLRPESKEEKPQGPPVIKRSKKQSFSNSISIKPTIKSKEEIEEAEIDLSKRPVEAFTAEKYAEVIKSFKAILKEKGKDSLATIFEVIPEISEEKINLLIENKALEDEFLSQKSDFLTYIRKELSNYNVQVVTEVNKDVKLKKAYTPQEKFNKMSEKNPFLNELVKKLDMDVGYA